MEKSVIVDLVPEIAKEAIEKGKLAMPISGNSMFPFLSSNNTITVVKCDTGHLWPGDIILYTVRREKQILIAHRIIKKMQYHSRRMFITKGDSCRRCDEPVDSSSIIGRIIEIKKTNYNIRLDNLTGRMLNTAVLLLSVINLFYFARVFFMKITNLEETWEQR